MTCKSFDLNIEKILENWQVRHAVREVIANALDEQVLSGTREVVIEKRGEVWVVRDFGRGLKYTHLTQNENQEKLDHSAVIGRFGIGLKDAMATFERHGVQVLIRSRFGVIHTTKATKHGFGDIFTLHAVIEDAEDETFEGTEVSMTGVDDAEMLAAQALFLKFSGESVVDATRYGQIITRSGGPGAIYINGVKVAEEDNFLFSYNIQQLSAALKKAINRERSHVGRSAYTDSVKKILLASESEEVARQLSSDMVRYQTGAIHDELAWLDVQEHAVKLLNAQRDVMMVTAEEAMAYPDLMDHARQAGKTILTIPENLREKLVGSVDLQGNPVVDLTAFAQTYNDSFVFDFVEPEQLTEAERQVFCAQTSILEVFGGQPGPVKSIRVSNTMRPDLLFGHSAAGCWDPATESIVIWRPQLRSVAQFAGILLHELVHAKTGYPDVSRQFETALTEQLGRVYEALDRAGRAQAPAQSLPPAAAANAKPLEAMVSEYSGWAAQVHALQAQAGQLQDRLDLTYEHLAQAQAALHVEKVRSSGLADQLKNARFELALQQTSRSEAKRPWYRFWN